MKKIVQFVLIAATISAVAPSIAQARPWHHHHHHVCTFHHHHRVCFWR